MGRPGGLFDSPPPLWLFLVALFVAATLAYFLEPLIGPLVGGGK